MTLAPFAALEQDMADATVALLANVVVTPEGGDAFGAEFNEGDAAPLDGFVTTGADVLVYRTTHTLTRGQAIDISGRAFKVADVPRRRSTQFYEAEVVPA